MKQERVAIDRLSEIIDARVSMKHVLKKLA
jgi:hypothetical protein